MSIVQKSINLYLSLKNIRSRSYKKDDKTEITRHLVVLLNTRSIKNKSRLDKEIVDAISKKLGPGNYACDDSVNNAHCLAIAISLLYLEKSK